MYQYIVPRIFYFIKRNIKLKHFTVIGNPINHSLSPKLHQWIFNQLNINAKYSKSLVNLEDLPNIINKLTKNELDGVNVTLPYKENIIKYLDEINPRAKSIGSVNCIMRVNNKIIGNNTDWFGFSQFIKIRSIRINKKEIIIIGAGGVSRAIIFSLIQNGAKKIRLFNRTLLNGKKLENGIITAYPLENINKFIKNDSIIINCTSVGMNKDQIPLSEKLIQSKQTIIDTIYNPYKTKLLEKGQDVGANTYNGLDMFIFQGITSLELWFGSLLHNKINLKEIKKYLKEQLL